MASYRHVSAFRQACLQLLLESDAGIGFVRAGQRPMGCGKDFFFARRWAGMMCS